MKKFISILLAITVSMSLCVTAFAASKAGDVNADGSVNSSDALQVLQYSVGILKTFKDKSAADLNKDGIINSSDALTILQISVGLIPSDPGSSTINGIELTKAPYSTNGLTITGYNTNEYGDIVVTVKNNTTRTIEDISNISYTTYNKSGAALDTDCMLFLYMLAPGESCIVPLYIEDNVAKVEFKNSEIFDSDITFPGGSTASYGGITMNKIPYSTNGLTITECTVEDYYAEMTIKNNTGHALDWSSLIPYKCYNSSGVVIESGYIGLNYMNANESSLYECYFSSTASKIIFGTGIIIEGDAFPNPTLATYYGIQMNKTPYTTNGLTVTGYTIEDDDLFSATVKNNTGSTIGGFSYIPYKCYDNSGKIISSGDLFFDVDIRNGSSASTIGSYIPYETTKLVFGNAVIDY